MRVFSSLTVAVLVGAGLLTTSPMALAQEALTPVAPAQEAPTKEAPTQEAPAQEIQASVAPMDVAPPTAEPPRPLFKLGTGITNGFEVGGYDGATIPVIP